MERCIYFLKNPEKEAKNKIKVLDYLDKKDPIISEQLVFEHFKDEGLTRKERAKVCRIIHNNDESCMDTRWIKDIVRAVMSGEFEYN